MSTFTIRVASSCRTYFLPGIADWSTSQYVAGNLGVIRPVLRFLEAEFASANDDLKT